MAEYIEREAFMEFWNKEFRHLYPNDKYLVALANFSAADVVEVRRGEWKEETEYYSDDYSECNVRKVFACSLCGRTEKQKEPYCNCGAKMDGKEDVK